MCLGIPGRITEINRDGGLTMGVVDFGGVKREVCLAYLADEVDVGDYAIVEWMKEVAEKSLGTPQADAS